MPSTTHGLPYPASSAAPNIPSDLQALANGLDSQLLTTVTSLPGSPVDGQRCLYLADATNGVVWDLRYRSASASTYKWEAVGGGVLSDEIATSQTTATTGSYVDLTTVGPTITVPLAGDYEIAFGALLSTSGGAMNVAPKFGAAAAADADDVRMSATGDVSVARVMRRTVSSAATTVKLVYKLIGGASSVAASNRCLTIRPIRVG